MSAKEGYKCHVAQTKSPRVAALGLFFSIYGRASVRLVAADMFIQPFADIVANYIGFDGHKEGNKYCHVDTPSLLPDWVRQQNKYSIFGLI